jgi:hypothetical protein
VESLKTGAFTSVKVRKIHPNNACVVFYFCKHEQELENNQKSKIFLPRIWRTSKTIDHILENRQNARAMLVGPSASCSEHPAWAGPVPGCEYSCTI